MVGKVNQFGERAASRSINFSERGFVTRSNLLFIMKDCEQ
jgi:hypothetical protein